MIIVLEGTDGSGKKTQSEMLCNHLMSLGKKCKLISFPNYASGSSAPVSMYLSGQFGGAENFTGYEACLLYAIDRMLTLKLFNADEYDYVIFDRYTTSSMVHQSENCNTKKDVDNFINWVEEFEYNIIKLPKPDKVIFLDVPIDYSINLLKARTADGGRIKNDILEDEQLQRRAYDRSKYVAHKNGWKTIKCVQNDKLLSKEIIHEKIKRIINNDY